MRLRSDLQREHERKMQEMREASRRMKEDCDHQVQLEKYVRSNCLKVCLHLPTPFPSPSQCPSKFTIVSMVTDSLTGRMGLEPILPVNHRDNVKL